MKRKLDGNDEPAPDSVASVPSTSPASQPSFASLGLDHRLVQAVHQQGFEQPTLVQRQTIPLALDGKDVLVKAKTGSGKTAAYILPLLQSIIKSKQSDPSSRTTALILAPTRELADQIFKAIESFTAFCAKDIQAVKLTDKVSDAVQRSMLLALPDIVISTPARAWSNIESSALILDRLTHLIIDEADLVLAYGHEDSLGHIAQALPKGVQTVLVSATLAEVDSLKDLLSCDPILIDVEEVDSEKQAVSQFIVKCAEDEKFLLSYVIFKLKLIRGKIIIFVGDVDRSYRLKLFLEQFGIRSCVLNSELPVNSRLHVVEQFNSGVYDVIIASDEHEVLGDEETAVRQADSEGDKEKVDEEAGASSSQKQEPVEARRPKKKPKTSRRDKEYGVSRGIDFKNVACVLNFDLPTSSKSYIHRIGRTGRAGQTGMALSFVIPKEQYRKHVPTSIASAEHDERILARIEKKQASEGKEIKPWVFDMKQIDAFRYRCNDALRAVTSVAVRAARTTELRQELLKSTKLSRHFEENPSERQHLIRHDGELRTARSQAHLKHVPDYLLPREGKKALLSEDVGFVPLRKDTKRSKHLKKGRFKGAARKGDPLRTFKARR